MWMPGATPILSRTLRRSRSAARRRKLVVGIACGAVACVNDGVITVGVDECGGSQVEDHLRPGIEAAADRCTHGVAMEGVMLACY
jgi:hypothetical protein